MEVFGAEVGQLMTFPEAPDVFRGIEFRGIRREGGQNHPAILPGHQVSNAATSVNRQSIPNDQQMAVNLAAQMAEKIHNLRSFDGPRIQAEIELPPRDAGDGRKILPVEVERQLWRLSTGSPCTTDVGTFRKPAFVYEDDGPPLPEGFFLRAGQVYRFQRRMASSSRSRAFRAGRWQLHPKTPSIFDTWPGWYETPQMSWMVLAIRGKVHSPLLYPWASGPSSNTRRRCSFWEVLKRDFRPVRPAERKPRRPACFSVRAQRETEVSLTRNCRATAACFTPWRRSFAASRRRCSSTLRKRASRLMPFVFPMLWTIAENNEDV